MRVLFLSLGVGNLFGHDIDPAGKIQLLNKMITEENYAYRTVNYRLGDKLYQSPFVAEALIDNFKPDKIMLVGTVKSAWSSFYAKYANNESKRDNLIALYNQEQANGLHESTDVSHLEECERLVTDIFNKIRNINGREVLLDITMLNYGLNDQELKFNFDILAKKWKSIIANSPDERINVAFDITHSFRSLPVFNMAIVNYLISLSSKKVSLDHVYYGNLDASYENNGIAEIVDLSDTTDLMRMTNGVAEFNNSGNTAQIITEIRGDNPEIARTLERFDWAIQTNRLVLLMQSIKELRILLQPGRTQGNNAILYEMILDNINNDFPSDAEIKEFEDIESNYTAYGHLQRMVGYWHLKHGRYGQAIVSGQEALASYIIPFYLLAQGKTVSLTDCTEFGYRQRAVSKTIMRKKASIEACRANYPDLDDCILRIAEKHSQIVDDRNVFAHIVWDLKEDSSFDIETIKKEVKALYRELLIFEGLIKKDLVNAEVLFKAIINPSVSSNGAGNTNNVLKNKAAKKLKSTEIHFFTAESLSKGKKLMFGHLENGKKVCMVVKKGTQVSQMQANVKVLLVGRGPHNYDYVERIKIQDREKQL